MEIRTKYLAILLATSAAIAQSPAPAQRHIVVVPSTDGVTVHMETVMAQGSVLLTGGGRLLGYRALQGGEAKWKASELPPGTYTLRATYQGARSEPIRFHVPANPVSRFGGAQLLSSKPVGIKALISVSGDAMVLGRHGLYTILRDANGNVRTGGPVAVPVGDSFALADFNGDGVPDLASTARGNIEVVFSQANGKPGRPISLLNIKDHAELAAGDFNGDGIADLAVIHKSTGEIQVFYGAADNHLQGPWEARMAGGPVHVATGDVNGDGFDDLVVADPASQRITVIQGAATGFNAGATYSTEGAPAAVTIGDFSGKGQPEIAWLSADGSVRMAGHPEVAGQVPAGTPLMLAGDVDHDGRLDLVFTGDTGVHVLWGLDSTGARPAAVTAHTQPTFTVTSAADDGGSGTLRSVLAQAAGSAPATVTFAISGTIKLQCTVYNGCYNPLAGGIGVPTGPLDGALSVPPGISIDGGTNGITISGNGAYRILELHGNSRIANLTLANGRAQGGDGGPGYVGGGGAAGMGGAAFVMGTGNQFHNVSFQNNQAVGGNGGNSYSSGWPSAGAGGGGLGGDGGQGAFGGTFLFLSAEDGGGGGGYGGVLGGNGGDGGSELDVDVLKLFSDLVEYTLAITPEIEAEELAEAAATYVVDEAKHYAIAEAIDAGLEQLGVEQALTLTFATTPSDGGPGGGGGGGGESFPLGMNGGFGGGGGGSADPVHGVGGRSLFGGGAGGGFDTQGPGYGGSGYGGAVFVYTGASIDFDGCTFNSNQATGGAGGLKDSIPVLGQALSAGGALFVAEHAHASINPANTTTFYGTNSASTGIEVSGQLAVSMTLTVSPSTLLASTPVSFTATVQTGALLSNLSADGVVDFYDGETFLGGGAVTNGQATFQGPRLPGGLRHLRAAYVSTSGLAGSATRDVQVKPVIATGPTAAARYLISYDPNNTVEGMTATDLNGDGLPDLAVVTSGPGTRESAIDAGFASSDGTFSTFGTYALIDPGSDGGIAAGDFGGKGVPSLAISDAGGGITIFTGSTRSAIPNTLAEYRMTSADFDRDGHPDIAAFNKIYLGDAFGNLMGEAGQPPLPTWANISTFVVADVNGDGIPDFISGDGSAYLIYVNLGNGDGTFQNTVEYNVGGPARDIAIGDFNGDGKPDIAVADAIGIDILLGHGDGTFALPVPYTLSQSLYGIKTGDFNGDGLDDLVVINTAYNNATICFSNGDGTFSSQTHVNTIGSRIIDFAVRDFNGDGTPDVAVLAADGYVHLLLNRPQYSITASRSTPSLYQSQSAQYKVTVNDLQGYSGTLTVNLSFPVPYQVSSANGWTCMTASACQITGNFAAGQIPPLLVTFTVPTSSTSYTFNASLGAPLNLSTSDTFTPLPSNFTFTVNPAQQYLFWDTPSTQFTVAVQNNNPVPFAGVQVVISLPAYLTAGTVSGSGWNCQGTTCTRLDTLQANASYPSITVPVTYSQQDQTVLAPMFSLQIKPVSGSTYQIASQSPTVQTGQRSKPALTVKPVSPSFSQGQQNVAFLINVTNSGGATVGPTTVSTTPGTGLSANSLSASGWTCSGTSCTTGLTLLPGVIYSLQANVNVAGNAPATVSEGVSLTTPGATASASGTANIIQSDLVMRVSHSGNFARGGPVAWSITVSNASTIASYASVSVTDSLPYLATATGIGGTGWNCDLPSLTCSRGDTLQPGYSYPPINVNATLGYESSSATDTATLTGAGAPFSASETVPLGYFTETILSAPAPSIANYGQPVTLNVQILDGTQPTGSVIFLDNGNYFGAAVVSGAAASYTSNSLTPGKHVLRAIYSGDATNGSSASSVQTVSVNQAAYNNGWLPFTKVPSGGRESPGPLIFDFNGDGIPDLAVPSNDNYSVTFYTGNGDGTFRQSQVVQLAGGLTQVIAGDFNGDGMPDVAVSGQGGIYIILNAVLNGTHRFVFPSGTNLGNYTPSCLAGYMAAGDFNLDGRVDIASVNACGGVDILFGNGDGTIGADVVYATNASGQPHVVIGDFNGDGIPDLAIGDDYGGAIHMLPGLAGGNFGPPIDTPMPVPSVGQFAPADFNQDGITDLVVPLYGNSPFDPTGGEVCMFLGQGNGTFQQNGACSAAPGASAAVALDFNEDGLTDAAYAFQGGLGFLMAQKGTYYGVPGISFVPVPTMPTDSDGIGIMAADFTNDGKMDLAVNTGQARMLDIFLNGSPRWGIQMSAVGTPAMGTNGAQYQVTVTNLGTVSNLVEATGADYTHGLITVTEIPGPGITITGLSGALWNCNVAALTCTRSDVWTSPTALPPITVTANVTATAITNEVQVSGGGAPNSPTAQLSAITTPNTVKLTLQGTLPGAVQVTVGNATYTLPAVVAVPVNTPTTVSVAQYSNLSSAGVRYRFSGWSDGGTMQHSVTLSADTTLTIGFVAQYQLTTSVYPLSSGTVTGAGWYDTNSQVTVTETPASGYVFSQWSGINGSTSPSVTFTILQPSAASANYVVSSPALSFTISSKADGTASPQRVWTLAVANKGVGTAMGVQITSAAITPQLGPGPVSLVTPLPVTVGNIASGQSASVPLTLSFPATTPATWVSLKLTFTANGGTYTVTQTLNLQSR